MKYVWRKGKEITTACQAITEITRVALLTHESFPVGISRKWYLLRQTGFLRFLLTREVAQDLGSLLGERDMYRDLGLPCLRVFRAI